MRSMRGSWEPLITAGFTRVRIMVKFRVRVRVRLKVRVRVRVRLKVRNRVSPSHIRSSQPMRGSYRRVCDSSNTAIYSSRQENIYVEDYYVSISHLTSAMSCYTRFRIQDIIRTRLISLSYTIE